MSVPVCPVCCDTLGRYGGPTTLPCGHNGCVQCMEVVQSHRAECPLCRAPFTSLEKLTVNHQLRDLVGMATNLQIDEKTRKDGWETFPTARVTNAHYSSELGSMAGSPRKGIVPSAPPLNEPLETSYGDGQTDVLALDPPQWIPDSHCDNCTACHLPFKALVRLRHHCRLCGRIFCAECSKKSMLLPPKFSCREPKRVCDMCASVLVPLQPMLIETMSRANQNMIHDVVDRTSIRSWLNNPVTSEMEEDIYKAANILSTFQRLRKMFPDIVAQEALSSAAGIAVISEAKLGLGFWSCRVGTGLVVSRENGNWSAPCAISCAGAGWGFQAGGEIMDLVLLLPNKKAVKAFTGNAQLSIGGSVSVALGVGVGRQAEATLKLGSGRGHAKCLSYGISRGAFVGISIEGAVIRTRDGMNLNFYGKDVSAKDLLTRRNVDQPRAAQILYNALDGLFGMTSGTPQMIEDVPPAPTPLEASTHLQQSTHLAQSYHMHDSTPHLRDSTPHVHSSTPPASVRMDASGYLSESQVFPPPPYSTAGSVRMDASGYLSESHHFDYGPNRVATRANEDLEEEPPLPVGMF